MDFKKAKENLPLCQEKNLPISEVMRQREILLGETTAKIVDQRMDRVLEIMKDAAFSPIKNPGSSTNFSSREKVSAAMSSQKVLPTLWLLWKPTLPWALSLLLLLPAVRGSFPD